MIARLSGVLIDHNDTSIVLDVSGVGYRLFVTKVGLETAKHLPTKDSISLYTHLAVRENSMDLYGFIDAEELRFFELLIGISGIGPKSALSILSIADIGTLKDAITQNDSSYLTKVSGIGTKSAQKIVLELQGKVDDISGGTGIQSKDLDTIDALTALGYSQNEVRSVLKEIPKNTKGTNDRIKYALKLLGK